MVFNRRKMNIKWRCCGHEHLHPSFYSGRVILFTDIGLNPKATVSEHTYTERCTDRHAACTHFDSIYKQQHGYHMKTYVGDSPHG